MSLTREQIEWHKGRLIYGTPGGSKHIIPVEDSVALCDLALQALTPASAWRPISEAPKDGNAIQAYNASATGLPFTVRWRKYFDGSEGWADDKGDERHCTHWMPLPPPPKAEDTEGR